MSGKAFAGKKEPGKFTIKFNLMDPAHRQLPEQEQQDTKSADTPKKVRKSEDIRNIELIIVLPFAGHDSDWDERSRRRLTFLMTHSTGQ